MFYKAVITSKGLALDAKIKAGQTTAAFTRVKLGDGTYDGQEDLKGAANLKNTRNEFGISSIKVIDENTVRIRIVTNNSSLNSGYYISELALFATDPDEGEILYSISLGVPGKMDYQPSKTEMLNATATIDILTSISDAETANIQTGTGAAASAEDLAELETRIKGVETPEFDASGSVDGITGKTTLLASFVSKMPLIKFMRNVKAGFKLVSFVGDIVNNCVTDNANLPLSAAQGKKLMDLYTVLNTNLSSKAGYGDNTYRGKQHVITYAGIGDRAYLNMQFVSEAPWSENNATRAGYGFHNSGSNGGALYLDTDSRLKFVASDTNTVYALDWHSL